MIRRYVCVFVFRKQQAMKKEAVCYFYDLEHFAFRFVKIINSLPKQERNIIIL